jgi:hypothetical protein
MKSKLRSDKTLDWLAQNSQIKIVAPAEPEASASVNDGTAGSDTQP